jgi:hypothetical protein
MARSPLLALPQGAGECRQNRCHQFGMTRRASCAVPFARHRPCIHVALGIDVVGRSRGKQLVRHRTRLDHENNETLYAYAQFLGESTEYVLNRVIDTVLARDKDFVQLASRPSQLLRASAGAQAYESKVRSRRHDSSPETSADAGSALLSKRPSETQRSQRPLHIEGGLRGAPVLSLPTTHPHLLTKVDSTQLGKSLRVKNMRRWSPAKKTAAFW